MLLKKSLTHAGVLISLIILVVLLLVNWNKCFVNPIEQWLRPNPVAVIGGSTNQPKTAEGFNTDITTATNKGVDARNITVDLNPTAKEVKVGFTGLFDADVPTDYVIKGYLLVMAKYDINLEKVGALDVKMTEESSGSTFINSIKAFIAKYTGLLSSSRKDSITALSEANTTTCQAILKAFLGSTTDSVSLTEFNTLTIQDINMFFELLGMVYKYQLSSTTSPKSLKAIYDEFRVVYPALIEANITPTPSGDPNYDYLHISVSTTDKNKQAANDLTKAIANYAALRTVLNPTGDIAGQPKKIVVDELRKFLQGLISQILNGYDQVINTVCNPETKKCGFTFTQVEPTDPQGNIYYYKLGVGVVFVNKNTGEETLSKIKSFAFGQGNKLQYFRVDTNLDDQEKLLKRLDELEKMNAQRALQQPQQQQSGQGGSGDCQAAAGMNAYMNMLKSYLGNYPDEFLLGTVQGRELTLDRYFTESLANGQINISADLSGLTPSTTAAAGRV